MMTQETIDRILRFDGDGLPVVSAYVRVEPDGSARTRVSSLVDQVAPLSRDRTLAHDARLSLRGDMDRIMAAAEEER
jgi:peptide chain release factor subunit 1